MIALEYAPDLGLELTTYRSCDRCGINMQISVFMTRRYCDDCIDFNVFEWGRFEWLFGKKVKP